MGLVIRELQGRKGARLKEDRGIKVGGTGPTKLDSINLRNYAFPWLAVVVNQLSADFRSST